MENSFKPPAALVIARSPIVEKNGMATWPFLKMLQNWSTQISNSLDQLGQFIGIIGDGAIVQNRTEGIGTTLQHLNSSGVVTAPGMVPATAGAQGAVVLPSGASANVLGTAAMASVAAFDAAGAAATAQANAETFASAAAAAAAATAQSNAEAYASNASNLSSGTVATALLAGISGTVTLAQLTTGGTQGSLTFTNGLITAVVNPT